MLRHIRALSCEIRHPRLHAQIPPLEAGFPASWAVSGPFVAEPSCLEFSEPEYVVTYSKAETCRKVLRILGWEGACETQAQGSLLGP